MKYYALFGYSLLFDKLKNILIASLHCSQMIELPEVMFPSVTVCNFNVVKLSALKDTKFSNLIDLEDDSEKGILGEIR